MYKEYVYEMIKKNASLKNDKSFLKDVNKILLTERNQTEIQLLGLLILNLTTSNIRNIVKVKVTQPFSKLISIIGSFEGTLSEAQQKIVDEVIDKISEHRESLKLDKTKAWDDYHANKKLEEQGNTLNINEIGPLLNELSNMVDNINSASIITVGQLGQIDTYLIQIYLIDSINSGYSAGGEYKTLSGGMLEWEVNETVKEILKGWLTAKEVEVYEY